MKAVLRHVVRSILLVLAKRELRRIRPKVIGVTGSVGKTSVKEAMAAVLSRRHKIKKSEKNYNSDFGVILTILGYKTGYSSLSSWMRILMMSFLDAFKKPESYELLVLEMGVDEPGNMQQILNVVTPDIMVFLNVKNVHRSEGQFPNKEAIFKEKSRAVLAVPKEGWAVLNLDDNYVRQLVNKIPASTLTIGQDEKADLRAKDVSMGAKGLSFTLSYEEKDIPVHLPHVLGECHVGVALAAIAVGFLNGLPWKTIEAGLKDFRLPPGRMNKIDGLKGSTLIDSSYNASPATMEEALKVLSLFKGRADCGAGHHE